jgi:hypothetical protein
VEGRLRSRCGGLVELQSTDDDDDYGDDTRYSKQSVGFLHKSVADFFAKDENWRQVILHTEGTDFEPSMAYLRSMLILIKRAAPEIVIPMYLLNIIFDVLRHVEALSTTSKGSRTVALLDELDRVMTLFLKSVGPANLSELIPFKAGGEITHWSDCMVITTREQPWQDNFLAFTVGHGLTWYARHKLEKFGKTVILKEGRPLLEYASCGLEQNVPHPDIVLMLLEHGADPNEAWGVLVTSVWHNSIALSRKLGWRHWTNWLLTLQYLVQYGADPNALVEFHGENIEGTPFVIRKSVLRYLRSRIRQLLKEPPELFSIQESVDYETEAKNLFEPAEKLFQLLVSKGAREEEWFELRDGESQQIYPEQPAAQPIGIAQDNQDRLSTTSIEALQGIRFTTTPIGPAKTKQDVPKPSRNLFKRLKKRALRAAAK